MDSTLCVSGQRRRVIRWVLRGLRRNYDQWRFDRGLCHAYATASHADAQVELLPGWLFAVRDVCVGGSRATLPLPWRLVLGLAVRRARWRQAHAAMFHCLHVEKPCPCPERE